ncbi:protein LYRIC [Hyperolius riggenbachi]|uniref:protein LYRIC n=1 Tax=Hyperolius riggenbachi TaxID=752182 RepID=UPI0035A29836
MASGWQEAAAQQAEEVSARLRQLLTTGLGLLRTELGLELGLQPHLYPSWVFLAAPVFLGLLLVLLLLHCASRKAGPQEDREPPAPLSKPAAVQPIKTGKAEDKKKTKKKSEKAKPNGRPVEFVEEEVIAPVKKESPKQQQQQAPPPLESDKKNEKAKKNKKKPKADVKPNQQSPSQEKKEAEEGNWETKISNKEKRQQRKRDKGADSDTLPENITAVTESFTLVSSQPTNVRKNKGPSEVSAVNGGSWIEKPTKVVPSQVVEEKWVTSAATTGKKKAEPCTWNQDAVDTNGKEWSAPWSERSIFPSIAPWTTVERIKTSEQRPPAFSSIGLNSTVSAAVSDSAPQPSASDSQWEATPAEPSADDEWSGLNGQSSADPSSDWNAPAEEWGNYGEEEPVPAAQIEEPEQEAAKASDDEKEKDESAQTSAGSKNKKKKKKKKQGEESGSPTQDTESTREALDGYKENTTPPPAPVVIPSVTGKTNESKETVKETRVHTTLIESTASAIHNVSEKSPPLVQQPQEVNTAPTKQNSAPPTKQNSALPTKQNTVPPPSQGKSEESWESPKQVKKKKKARRET